MDYRSLEIIISLTEGVSDYFNKSELQIVLALKNSRENRGISVTSLRVVVQGANIDSLACFIASVE